MNLNSQNYSELVLESDKPVVVEFMRNDSWLCKLMQGRVNNVLNNVHSQIEYFRIDIYRNSDLRESFRIKDIPTFFFYCKGEIISSISGLESEAAFSEKVKDLIDMYEQKTNCET